jgi:hypothetical protein
MFSFLGFTRSVPNAQTHLPPEAGARDERTLAAVACTPWCGDDSASRLGVDS